DNGGVTSKPIRRFPHVSQSSVADGVARGAHPSIAADVWKAPGISYVDVAGGAAAWAPFLESVRETAGASDVLVVYLHVGSNYQPVVPASTIAFARAIADAGATIVAVTSPHHLQHVERYSPRARSDHSRYARSALIFYSLGDAIDDY